MKKINNRKRFYIFGIVGVKTGMTACLQYIKHDFEKEILP